MTCFDCSEHQRFRRTHEQSENLLEELVDDVDDKMQHIGMFVHLLRQELFLLHIERSTQLGVIRRSETT